MSSGPIPDVAVLISARDESAAIGRCLEHVLAQDVPRDRLEVVVVDGASDDATGEIATSMLEPAGLARWVVHRNADGSTPSNLNAGLALLRAPVVCRVDARSLIPPHYARTCSEVLALRPEVAVVGGSQLTVPRSGSVKDRGIARALNNRYGTGLSRYRRRVRSGPSDTVYLGAFRTTELRGLTAWDERFGINQDFDLNRRMSEHGLVWFDDSLEVGYLPRRTIRGLWRKYHRNGRWKVRYWRETGDRPRPRQWAMILGTLGLLGALLAVCRGVPRRHLAALALVAAAGAVVDEIGSSEPGSPGERAVAVGTLVAVASGWVGGVAQEWALDLPRTIRSVSGGGAR